MQNRQYFIDPYLKEYSTKLVSSTKIDGKHHAVLANTIFYPEGGGQPGDLGYLNDTKVIDVYEQNGVIYHVCENEIKAPIVVCKLDWQRRFEHMQYHTGQHILSAILYRHFNYQTCSFHLGTNYSTIDIDTKKLTPKEIDEVENFVNNLIQDNVLIKSYFINPEEPTQLDLRKQPQDLEDIRIVEITNFDSAPCCGTHLKTSGEVGLLKIIKTEKHKYLTRIYYHCGMKAFSEFQEKHKTITTLARLFSTSESGVLDRVTAELESKKELEHNYKKLQKQVFNLKAQSLVKKTKNNLIETTLDDQDSFDDAQHLADEILAQGPFTVIISVGNRLLITHNNKSGLHCGNLIKQFVQDFDGRGGGNASFGQVFFPSKNKMDQFIGQIKKQLS